MSSWNSNQDYQDQKEASESQSANQSSGHAPPSPCQEPPSCEKLTSFKKSDDEDESHIKDEDFEERTDPAAASSLQNQCSVMIESFQQQTPMRSMETEKLLNNTSKSLMAMDAATQTLYNNREEDPIDKDFSLAKNDEKLSYKPNIRDSSAPTTVTAAEISERPPSLETSDKPTGTPIQ